MEFVTRLFVREEIDALELELAEAKRAHEPDFVHIQKLKHDVAVLEAKLARRPGRSQLAG